jgi:membrane-bound metal-dependent hydrolase YbcI (DUF457 family)
MFIGHFGLGFAAKKLDSKPSLGTAFLATQFIDLLWPFFLLAGIEKVAIEPGNTAFTPLNFISYPFSHSLAAVLIWAVLFGGVYYLIRKDGKSALVLALLVVSHWLLDLLTHRPDLPLSFSEETKVGLGLWNQKAATIVVEMLIFSLGIYLYLQSTTAKNNKGKYALWSLVVFFLVIYVMNILGDPPPDAEAIGYVGLAQWLFIAWGYWVDNNRTVRVEQPSERYTAAAV